MPLLTASNLTQSFGAERILDGIFLAVEPKEKVALIGRNGTGKTTLLRLLAGLDEPDAGALTVAPWARVGYLPQTAQGEAGTTIIAHVLSGAPDVQTLERRVRELEQKMADPAVHEDAARLAAVMDEYARAREHFDHIGGFTLPMRAGMVLSGLGFAQREWDQPLGALSGGWRVRAELARVLLTEPDLLLLDEPTNHLDLTATEWLEEYLRDFPGAAVVVSHDRFLLDAVTSRTLELEDTGLASYPGSYSAYAQLKAEQAERTAELFEQQQETIAKLEAYIRRYKAGNRATMAKSREKMLARVQARRIAPPRERGAMRVRAQASETSGRLVVRLERVGKRFGDRDVLADVSLEIYRGERIGLLGANGAGKSTLMKLIAGLEAPTSGRVALGVKVRARYFAQESTEALVPENSVLDEILADRPMTPEQVRTYLGRFLFSGEEVFKRVGMLSGGERQRLSLAKLLLDQPNLLLLDEPTNHLDIPSREALEAALREFDGTMIVATHDRYLLERLAARILTVENKSVGDFRGTYHELRARRATTQASAPRPTTRRPKAKAADAPLPRSSFDQVAAEIAAVERELEDAGRKLSDPEIYRDAERVKAERQRYTQAEHKLTALYELLAQVEEEPGRDG